LRGIRVILDSDLARLYGVEAKRFNEQVGRNRKRFPADFLFRIANHELAILRSQFATSSWGGRRYPPLAFTEHGAIMAASILNSDRAIEVSVYVVRAFVQMRDALVAHKEVGRRLNELERKVGTHDRAIGQILAAIRELTQPPETPKRRRIGFL
jgi:hypothetical protein